MRWGCTCLLVTACSDNLKLESVKVLRGTSETSWWNSTEEGRLINKPRAKFPRVRSSINYCLGGMGTPCTSINDWYITDDHRNIHIDSLTLKLIILIQEQSEKFPPETYSYFTRLSSIIPYQPIWHIISIILEPHDCIIMAYGSIMLPYHVVPPSQVGNIWHLRHNNLAISHRLIWTQYTDRYLRSFLWRNSHYWRSPFNIECRGGVLNIWFKLMGSNSGREGLIMWHWHRFQIRSEHRRINQILSQAYNRITVCSCFHKAWR